MEITFHQDNILEMIIEMIMGMIMVTERMQEEERTRPVHDVIPTHRLRNEAPQGSAIRWAQKLVGGYSSKQYV